MIKKISYHAIWKSLKENWKVACSEEVMRRHTPCESTTLVECQNCGLQYFLPLVAGDAQFYRELSLSPFYYVPDKWEFRMIQKKLSSACAVLDIGCGEGRFLKSIHPQVRQAVGLDTNPEAVDRASALGLDVHLENIFDFAYNHPEEFDVVCCLQLIEHLEQVQPFLQAALVCLRPGGTLILSVPNRQRLFCQELEPLDCPPHHVSRWHSKQFKMIAELLNLELLYIDFKMVEYTDLRNLLRQYMTEHYNRFWFLYNKQFAYWVVRILARFFITPMLYNFYQKIGLFEKCGRYGHTMIAAFIK
jgi:SAM-dependent methyltransferase